MAKKKDIKTEASVNADSAEVNDTNVEAVIIENKTDELEKTLAEAKDSYLRLLAEYDNYRRRTQNAITEARAETAAQTVSALLPAMDSAERALATVTDENSKTGIGLIVKQISGVFAKYNLEAFGTVGEDFSPEIHNAIAKEENEEQKGKIVEVYQKGYKCKDKILRYAMVKVGE
jgi:molecular chaperone GrpE